MNALSQCARGRYSPLLFLASAIMIACAGSDDGPAESGPLCTGTPQITPDPLPVLAPGQTTPVNFIATCTSTPELSWRSSDTLVMRVVGSGANAFITARMPGSATISAQLVADAAFRASARARSEASYNLVTVAGQPLPATVQLQTPDVLCESAHRSQAIYKSGRLTLLADSTFQADFAWTRVCISPTGERKPREESATAVGIYDLIADSLAFAYTRVINPGEVCNPPCVAGGGRLLSSELNLSYRVPGFIVAQPMLLRQQ